MTRRVAIVNDDENFLILMEQALGDEGFDTLLCRESISALERMRAFRPHTIVLDIRMERPDTGWALLDQLKQDQCLAGVPVLICSSDVAVPRGGPSYLQDKACWALPMPFDLDDLIGLLNDVNGRAA